jgi:hypothetical protein
MSSTQVLCDPALLLPPSDELGEPAVEFWSRLIAWNSDRRVGLGPMTYEVVSGTYTDLDWQSFQPPMCPEALASAARRAVYGLLARLLRPSADAAVTATPSLRPRHIAGGLVEEAIALDAAMLHDAPLRAIASSHAHWAEASDTVAFNPPPPDRLPILFEPGERLAAEVDDDVSAALRGRRVTIIGGRESPLVLGDLSGRFGVSANETRWIEADGNKRMQLELLNAVRPDRDIVFCVTGYISHADSQKVIGLTQRRGVVTRCVEKRREIVGALIAAYSTSAE